jgi:hypothetical protein
MRGVSTLIALAIAAPAVAAPSPRVGLYNASEMELVAGLELKADGKFRFGLSYGAIDEQAEGRWVEKDGKILLTTEPAVVPPRFALVKDEPVADGSYYAALDEPEALGDFSLTLAVKYQGETAIKYIEADENGRVPIAPGKVVETIVPDLPVYSAPYRPFPMKPGGHRLVFHFEANDVGKADFKAEPLAIVGDDLVLKRYQREIDFKRGLN